MIIEREQKGNKYSKPIITEQHIEFIKEKYNEGLSQVSIAKLMNVSDRMIRSIMKENNIGIRSDREQALKYTCNENFFENIDSEEKAYWLGFMYADGFIQNKRKHSGYKVGITLSVVDKDHLEKFKKSIDSNCKINTYEQNSGFGGDYSRLLISSNKMAEDLIKNGCLLNKTEKIVFPNENILPKELLRHFIRGYIDGDGSVNYSYLINSKNGLRDKFESKIGVVGTKEFLEGLLEAIELSHLKIGKRHKDREVNNYQVNIGGNVKVDKMLDWIYKDSTIYLDRKYKKYLEIKSKYKRYLVELASNS